MEGAERVEDARVPKPAPSPTAPTRAEREAHEATHMPYRSWCMACVQGRALTPPHRRLCAGEEEERRLSEVHIDFAFLRRSDSDVLAKLVVLKTLPSRAMRAWVVPDKGIGDGNTADRVYAGIKELGLQPPYIIKCDGEPAAEALREQLISRAGEGVVPQSPPVGESQSNGVVDNGVRVLKGLIRTHVLALEAKINARIPAEHPILAWLAEAVGDMVSKHLRGQDGRTAYERLYGKPPREEGLEFGEVVLWRKPKHAGMNVLLEARWEEGIWLGRTWGGITHLIGVGREVKEVRAVQRRPKEERWSVARVQGLLATPWRNPAPADAEEVQVLSPRPPDDLPDQPRPPASRDGPKQVYIRDEDLMKYGYTVGCRRCALMRDKQPARGIRHSVPCLTRIEAAMEAEGDERLRQANLRRDSELTRLLEANNPDVVAARLPESDVQVPRGAAAADDVAPAVDANVAEDVRVAPEEPEVEGSPEEMHVEPDGDEEVLGALWWDALPLVRTPRMRREAVQIYELMLVSGVSPGDAEAKIIELYSPPRVTALIGTLPNMSLAGGPTFDLRQDENGASWDFRRREDRQRARARIREERPFVVIGSPPCTFFSSIQALSRHRSTDSARRRAHAEALTLLGFAVEIYRLQLDAGRHFVHEHPAHATSWS